MIDLEFFVYVVNYRTVSSSLVKKSAAANEKLSFHGTWRYSRKVAKTKIMRKRSSSHTESSLSTEGRHRNNHSNHSHGHQGGILASASLSSSSQHRMTNQSNMSSGQHYNKSFSNPNNNIGSHDDALRRMLKLVNSFFSRSDCIPFREPVDWRGLELWDYPKIIKKVNSTQTFRLM